MRHHNYGGQPKSATALIVPQHTRTIIEEPLDYATLAENIRKRFGVSEVPQEEFKFGNLVIVGDNGQQLNTPSIYSKSDKDTNAHTNENQSSG